VFLGEAQVEAKERSPIMVWSVVALAILSLVSGIAIRYPFHIASVAVQQMMTGVVQ
jgi:NADH:ubiquinone oxidoreductase subunit 5 (subunit L)/multisubunit Na+/H+ antiporter MnhA subunit